MVVVTDKYTNKSKKIDYLSLTADYIRNNPDKRHLDIKTISRQIAANIICQTKQFDKQNVQKALKVLVNDGKYSLSIAKGHIKNIIREKIKGLAEIEGINEAFKYIENMPGNNELKSIILLDITLQLGKEKKFNLAHQINDHNHFLNHTEKDLIKKELKNIVDEKADSNDALAPYRLHLELIQVQWTFSHTTTPAGSM